MKTLKALIILGLLVASCAEEQLDEPGTPQKNDQEANVEENESGESQNLDGLYKNGSDEAVLVITNYIERKGFDYQLMLHGPDECQGVEYAGSAFFDSDNHAKSDLENEMESDNFTIKSWGILMEPATSMVGMECLRMLNLEFKPE